MIDFLLHADDHLRHSFSTTARPPTAFCSPSSSRKPVSSSHRFCPATRSCSPPAHWRRPASCGSRCWWSVFIVAAVLGDAVNYWSADASRTCSSTHRTKPGPAPLRQARVTCSARTSSSNGMAAVPWSSRGSCRSSARSCPSSPAAPACPTASFTFYNVTGAMLWVGICVGAGYLFGNIPIVKDNFELVVARHRRRVAAAARRRGVQGMAAKARGDPVERVDLASCLAPTAR